MRTQMLLFAILLATPAPAQDYNRADLIRGLCQPNGCDEFGIVSVDPVRMLAWSARETFASSNHSLVGGCSRVCHSLRRLREIEISACASASEPSRLIGVLTDPG